MNKIVSCEWCSSLSVEKTTGSVFWELPDGTRAIEIEQTPTFQCKECNMEYQPEEIVSEIEDQLYLIDTSKIGKVITHEELMKIPRFLKKNYFRF
ncbi:putative YokU family protein [Bacillus pakistanensis]|uniref:YokU family protein n=1 Tax=Rossellomorea pakistanensis TaxID=992288 RepID=A0ABS2N9J0_9BACI|nr:YokU family protein [Bacillus pakistanensis]MBM7584231.1 putative YokU family protein [Bacillus pakistanensis]